MTPMQWFSLAFGIAVLLFGGFLFYVVHIFGLDDPMDDDWLFGNTDYGKQEES